MKLTNRIRVATADAAIENREMAESEVCALANLTLERNSVQILLDDAINKLREKYGPTIADYNKDITDKSERLRTWAELNPDEFPKGKKSIEMSHGTIGFRTGTPKLKTISRKTWDAVLQAIKAMGLRAWIRTEETVNKEQIIADARGGAALKLFADEHMRAIGVKVVQDETFFIEPKLEELKKRITEAA